MQIVTGRVTKRIKTLSEVKTISEQSYIKCKCVHKTLEVSVKFLLYFYSVFEILQ